MEQVLCLPVVRGVYLLRLVLLVVERTAEVEFEEPHSVTLTWACTSEEQNECMKLERCRVSKNQAVLVLLCAHTATAQVLCLEHGLHGVEVVDQGGCEAAKLAQGFPRKVNPSCEDCHGA